MQRGEPPSPLGIVKCSVWLDCDRPEAIGRLVDVKEDSPGWKEGPKGKTRGNPMHFNVLLKSLSATHKWLFP